MSVVFWLGTTTTFRCSTITSPQYCLTAVCDSLEFALLACRHFTHAKPLNANDRSSSLCSHDSSPNTFLDKGLYPYHQFTSSEPTFVATQSPFTSIGWCHRQLTTKEIIRLFDIPVAIESRIAKCNNSFEQSHPLLSSVPTKVLMHSLWLTGHFMIQREGGDRFKPDFTINKDSGLLVSQNEFNYKDKNEADVDIKAVKMDDAVVPVQLGNNRLLSTYPNPSNINKAKLSSLSFILDFLRKRALRQWKCNLFKSLKSYLKSKWKIEYSKYQNGY
jgi:hypothetical protein